MLCVRVQAKKNVGHSHTHGADLVWMMLQILEKGEEKDWVLTIVKVRSRARHRTDGLTCVLCSDG